MWCGVCCVVCVCVLCEWGARVCGLCVWSLCVCGMCVCCACVCCVCGVWYVWCVFMCMMRGVCVGLKCVWSLCGFGCVWGVCACILQINCCQSFIIPSYPILRHSYGPGNTIHNIHITSLLEYFHILPYHRFRLCLATYNHVGRKLTKRLQGWIYLNP